tara:strand:- start:329 stop:946 length:618 start_codon:yes stop_codon:yes gene_type:complete
MYRKKNLFIFDLDGVLIDSLPNMKQALKKTSQNLNIRLNFNVYKKYIGLPFEEIMRNMGVKKDIQLIKKNYIFFSSQNLKKIKINNVNLRILKKLKINSKLAIFTSKDSKRTNAIISKYKLFDFIVTSDDVRKGKPNPSGLFKIIKFFNFKKKDTYFIGDSYYDYKCASNAQVKYCHALWGYHKIKNYKNINKLKKLQQILNFVK